MTTNKKILIGALATAALIGAGLVGMALAGDSDDEISPMVLQSEVPADAELAEPVRAGTQSIPDDGGSAQLPIDSDDRPISPDQAKRIEAVALDIAGGGTVTDIDRSDDPGEAFEVEVSKGLSEVDIALDGSLNRVQNTHYDD